MPLLTTAQYRRRFLFMAVGNLAALAGTLFWFPAARLNLSAPHALLALATGALSAMAASLCVLGILIPAAGRQLSQTGAALHLLRLLPAIAAISCWPGGDGGKTGWTGIAVPVMVLIALFSIVGVVRDFRAQA